MNRGANRAPFRRMRRTSVDGAFDTTGAWLLRIDPLDFAPHIRRFCRISANADICTSWMVLCRTRSAFLERRLVSLLPRDLVLGPAKPTREVFFSFGLLAVELGFLWEGLDGKPRLQ